MVRPSNNQSYRIFSDGEVLPPHLVSMEKYLDDSVAAAAAP